MSDANPSRGRFAVSVLAGAGVAVACAIGWGLMEYSLNRVYQLLPLAVAILVGLAMRAVGPAGSRSGVVAATLTIAGSLLGPVVFLVIAATWAHHVPFALIAGHPDLFLNGYPRATGVIGFLALPVAAMLAYTIQMRRRPAGASAPGPAGGSR